MEKLISQTLGDDERLAFARRQIAKQCKLHYLKVKPLNSSNWGYSRRNVQLRPANENEYFKRCIGNPYAWKHARWLEDRNESPLQEGCYGISQRRSERFLGAVPNDLFGYDSSIEDVSEGLAEYGKQFRPFAYLPLENVADLLEFQSLCGTVNCSLFINSDWYDPPNGSIPMPSSDSVPCGTHSLTPAYDPETQLFHFDNTWGWEWGDEGSGTFSTEYLERHVTEILGFAGFMDQLPYVDDQDFCVGWKWALSEKFSIHGREIIEGNTGERMAWAFGTRRGDELVIHEFFVWPTYRNRGLGRKVAELMLQLCNEMKIKPRLRVPYVDCLRGRLEGVRAVGKMFRVEFSESTNKLYCLDGFGGQGSIGTRIALKRDPPPPAASPLEWLRRRQDPPLIDPVKVPVLFGTNRKYELEGDSVSFGNARNSELTCGFSVVEVTEMQSFGSASRTWRESMVKFCTWLVSRFAEVERDASRVNVVDLNGFKNLSSFLNGDEESRHHLVYVHGFKTTFDSAMAQAARLKADLALKGNIYLFSWPSAGNPAMYASDEAAVEASIPFFTEFMQIVRDSVDGEPLSLLAHSMGNRLLARWTETQSSIAQPAKLRDVIFAAPDVDHDVFSHSLKSWRNVYERATLYANSADLALQLSEIKHLFARAGLIPPIVQVNGLEVILVQGFDLFDFAHGYFAEAGNTLHDICVMLRFDAPAKNRPAIRKLSFASGATCWSIPHR
ncbi:alpha/beta hydrolase [Rosistilla oblonga]|uniref:alpha/beta hydrolase n=1 Tax=Rosistilla oblonga TaxID=2527990 RepID=UPI003A98405E